MGTKGRGGDRGEGHPVRIPTGPWTKSNTSNVYSFVSSLNSVLFFFSFFKFLLVLFLVASRLSPRRLDLLTNRCHSVSVVVQGRRTLCFRRINCMLGPSFYSSTFSCN